jgi:hypothetical protein
MPRPHEDLERHTPVDHRPGGLPVEFARGAWCAVALAHVAANRMDAEISSFETLVEKARSAPVTAHAAAVLRAVTHRRVVGLIDVGGHEAFAHLQSAWDAHHLNVEHHAAAESISLLLYRLVASSGEGSIDPGSTDAYAFEHVPRAPEGVRALGESIASAPGFRGALVFGGDDAVAASTSAILYRFEHAAQIETFRESSAARDILGPKDEAGESFFALHPVKTFS